jgi:hypothetical protein
MLRSHTNLNNDLFMSRLSRMLVLLIYVQRLRCSHQESCSRRFFANEKVRLIRRLTLDVYQYCSSAAFGFLTRRLSCVHNYQPHGTHVPASATFFTKRQPQSEGVVRFERTTPCTA